MAEHILWLEDLTADDTEIVGGKNASLGEMIRALRDEGVRVPDGFATSAEMYREFLEVNDLEERLREELGRLDDGAELEEVGEKVRGLFLEADFDHGMADSIADAYRRLCEKEGEEEVAVAVRSSATAEDLPEASFAGQQETFLNVRGREDLIEACQRCYASLFTDRAISYREENDFDHLDVALSIGVQKMVRADTAGSGVMFTLDTETGFPDVVVINAAWGLGETVVQGSVNPDEYRVFAPLLDEDELRPILSRKRGSKEQKLVYASGDGDPTEEVRTSDSERKAFVLDDDEVLRLARWGKRIQEHYERPMDIEWAKDGESGELHVLQARPETVQSQAEPAALRRHELKEDGKVLVQGLAIGKGIASGEVRVVEGQEQMDRVGEGDVLVTGMTDPDWVPAMRRAAAVITDSGGRTCHAAIVSRELGIPAVVGTGEATSALEDGQEVTVDCAAGEDGRVLDGALEFEEEEIDLEDLPDTRTAVMMNVASPDAASRWWRLPCDGIGLARMEFIVNNAIEVHPMALLHPDRVDDDEDRERIEELIEGYASGEDYFVERLAESVASIAAVRHPDPVIVRMSDFKSNEYAQLVGGRGFEPDEENPMLGVRGASRYYSERYREGFVLECRAMRRVRNEIGLRNVALMIPFCRTVEEGERVLAIMADEGLVRGEDGLEIHVMAEIPSNVLLAEGFAEHFDGFSIGTNDLTQLVLGVDRDSAELSEIYDERNEAVKAQVRTLIEKAHDADRKVGICGQAPSDHPDFAEFLVECGIDSISVDPDSVIEVRRRVAEAESD